MDLYSAFIVVPHTQGAQVRITQCCRPRSSWLTVSHQYDAGHPSYDVLTTSLGDRAFAVAGPRVWNSLPPAICDPSLSPSIFGKLLKTYLFV